MYIYRYSSSLSRIEHIAHHHTIKMLYSCHCVCLLTFMPSALHTYLQLVGLPSLFPSSPKFLDTSDTILDSFLFGPGHIFHHHQPQCYTYNISDIENMASPLFRSPLFSSATLGSLVFSTLTHGDK